MAFSIGACSMVGIPMFSGFISKLLFAQAAVQNNLDKMLPTLICLAISTVLNAIYFMKTVITIYTPPKGVGAERFKDYHKMGIKDQPLFSFALILMIILNMILGCCSQPIVNCIETGLAMFG